MSAPDPPATSLVDAPSRLHWGMTRPRLWVAHGAILLLLAGSAYDIIRGREHWPFSCYPMYSKIELDSTMTQLRIFGVPVEGSDAELILQDRCYLEPFDNSRLGRALKRIQANDDSETNLPIALADCLERYEALRLRGRHDGPKLRALRLYALSWTLDPRAANRDRPEKRRLIAEVQLGSAREPKRP